MHKKEAFVASRKTPSNDKILEKLKPNPRQKPGPTPPGEKKKKLEKSTRSIRIDKPLMEAILAIAWWRRERFTDFVEDALYEHLKHLVQGLEDEQLAQIVKKYRAEAAKAEDD
jgi:hypothetical protein